MKKIAIVTPTVPAYSETFLWAHIKKLPAKVFHFYSLPQMGYYPIYGPDSKPLFSDSKPILFLEHGIELLLNNKGYGHYFRKKTFKQWLVNEKIEAILCEYGPTGTYLIDLAEECNIPLYSHFHGRDAYHYQTLKKFGLRYLNLFKKSAGIIVVSNDMKNQLIKIGANHNKILVNPCTPNDEIFSQINKSQLGSTFITTGRFTEKKAPLITISAFYTVKKTYPNAKLIMLADGPLLNKCKARVKKLGLQGSVKFLGPKKPEEVFKLFKQSDIFVQHSVRASDGDSEGTPVAILEAMLSGLPVVSTRHAGIPDVVIEIETGILVNEHDEEAMADAMLYLLDNPKEALQMGVNGHKRVISEFTMKNHIETLWKFMDKDNQ